MLAITRKVGQSVTLHTSDGPILVELVSTDRGKARIGFQAPMSVRINRNDREVLAIEAKIEDAAQVS